MAQQEETPCILLYYKYVEIGDQRRAVADWFREACQRLNLKGRVRIALDGVNVTVGGARKDVMQHIADVKAHATLASGGEEIDFKLSESHGALNKDCCVESGFQQLAIRECDELVSLNLQQHKGCAAETSAVFTHSAAKLTPTEFHSAMGSKDNLVLIDTRNIYEHSIGHMHVEGVDTLRPPTRCFSDWPQWLDKNLPQLANKRVLMYCTGGVRCERASAYLRSKGTEYSNVQQLRGGIERYLEQFPDGGHFQGKNFVFDERVVHPNSLQTGVVVGKCLRCGTPHDDYGARHRCRRCRMLVLLCPACAPHPNPAPAPTSQEAQPSVARDPTANQAVAEAPQPEEDVIICELCRAREAEAVKAQQLGPSLQKRKLRVLALHGFRENASRFRGRMRAFMKRLHHHLDLDFLQAPHALPILPPWAGSMGPPMGGPVGGSAHAQHSTPVESESHAPCGATIPGSDTECTPSTMSNAKTAESSDLIQIQNGSTRCATLRAAPQHEATTYGGEDSCVGEGEGLSCIGDVTKGGPVSEHSTPLAPGTPKACESMARQKLKYAWFHEPDGEITDSGPSETLLSQIQRQTCGWKQSLAQIQAAIQDKGPYDGIIGFSQGCAVATMLIAVSELALSLSNSVSRKSACSHTDRLHPISTSATVKEEEGFTTEALGNGGSSEQELCAELQQAVQAFADVSSTPFKFALLFSGHRGVCPEAQRLIEAAAPLATPSMHVYGSPGKDQQVPHEESEELAGLFRNAKVVVHEKGHVIPSSKADCQTYLDYANAAVR